MKRDDHFNKIRAMRCRCLLSLMAGVGLWLHPVVIWGQTDNLRSVKDIEAFSGSAGAKELLSKNGFVVADPSFKQIFEAYIKAPQIEEPTEKNPMGGSLPSYITPDSAWHTYHVLLEEGVKNMEEIQSKRLHDFSQRLLASATNSVNSSNDLIQFASVGLALQDEPFRQTLATEAKRIVDGLRNGSTPVAVPIGFELAPAQFRAQSFYTQSPELSNYFAARQWYASVVFRLANPRETKLALSLTSVINGDPELLTLWRQLSEPFDAFLGTAEDGTVREYGDAEKVVIGSMNIQNTAISGAQFLALQKRLEAQLPLPQVSDQLMAPAQYVEFGKQTRGFRLLPSRRLPDAVCFHNTVDPKISGREYPSGLDFLAASPALTSPAARRAVQGEFGKSVGDQILKADCGPLPDSLHGEAMRLLATLQKPFPATAPAPLRTEAWSDLQLWTQLGAWAEQRHTWALHTKMTVMVMGMISPPRGVVAPYPDFFAGLAKLTRQTAVAFDKGGLGQSFEIKPVAAELLTKLELSERISASRDEKDMEENSAKLVQFGQFYQSYYEKHRAEFETNRSRDANQKIESALVAMAQRCAVTGTTNAAEIETLRLYYDSRQNISRLLNDYAPVCDRLAALATKSLTGEVLTEDDGKWIENYGVTLAGFSFYYGNSYEVPRDDFPMVTRVFSSPLTSSMLYAGVARPQALYVIIPQGKTLQLYRGAVLTYREFVRPNDPLLDDDAWREMIFKGQTPPPPSFTRSFYAEASVGELLIRLHAQAGSENANYGDTQDILFQIGSRATEKDFPALFNVLTHAKGDEQGDVVDGIAEIIGNLPWQKRQKQMVELLASPDTVLAKAMARIFIEHPALLDASLLTTGFTHQSPRTRRLYCAILSHQPQQTEATRKLLLQAMQDPGAGVRWQAALALGKVVGNGPQVRTALLLAVNDTNQFVGAAAAYSLTRLGATNAAPALFEKLKATLASNNTPIDQLASQAFEIQQEFRGDENHSVHVLDTDNIGFRLYVNAEVTANIRKRAAMRLPPRPFDLPIHNYDLAYALIEALGDLRYVPATDELFKLSGTDYEGVATAALGKLAPTRLTVQLLGTAKDKQLDSYLREKALVTLCNLAATNCVRDLIPLLDDTTPITYSPPMRLAVDWQVCDRAAVTIATLLGWENRMAPVYFPQQERDETMARVRDWAKQAQ
jgi:HEAT repeat protein